VTTERDCFKTADKERDRAPSKTFGQCINLEGVWQSFSRGARAILDYSSSKMAQAPLFFTENGSSYKTFGRAPPKRLESKLGRSPTKQAPIIIPNSEDSIENVNMLAIIYLLTSSYLLYVLCLTHCRLLGFPYKCMVTLLCIYTRHGIGSTLFTRNLQ
jgi:hypothetical protein